MSSPADPLQSTVPLTSAEVRCEVDNTRFQRVVPRQDVVQLKVGITDHVQQDSVDGSHVLFGQIPRPLHRGVLLV